MINQMPKSIALGLCLTVCTGLIAFAGGCAKEEEQVVVAPPPPPPPPPPAAPSVTPIEQLMAEMNIDPRVSLPEDKAPDNDVDRRAVLSFFDGFARGNDKAVSTMLPETDRPQLVALVESGAWKDTTGRITKIDIQCGSSPLSDKCALAVVEVKSGGDAFQPQLWTYKADGEAPVFEAVPTPPGILDKLSGDWITRWFAILEEELALADKADEEYAIAQRDLDDGKGGDTVASSGSSAPSGGAPGKLREPTGAPQEAPGIPGGGESPR